MPAVVSDSGPLIHLAQLDKLRLLQKLFDRVLITTRVKVEVFDEGVRLGYPDAEIVGQALEEGWLEVESMPERLAKTSLKLAVGENISRTDAETLLLAKEKKADLLVDEKAVSALAKMYGLKVWNTWTLLLESLSKDFLGLTDVEAAVNELGRKKFRLSNKQANEVLNSARIIEKRKARTTP